MVTYLLIGWRHYDVIGWRHRVSRGVKIADASGPGPAVPIYYSTHRHNKKDNGIDNGTTGSTCLRCRLCINTLVSRKVCPLVFDNNFGKCGPIFKIQFQETFGTSSHWWVIFNTLPVCLIHHAEPVLPLVRPHPVLFHQLIRKKILCISSTRISASSAICCCTTCESQ